MEKEKDMLVSEEIIDGVISTFDNEGNYQQFSISLVESQPGLIAYLESESNSILTEEEKDLQWYCTAVILKSIEIAKGALAFADTQKISKAEENNYALVDDKNQKFKMIADTFFADCIEEDLLAFVEDTLIPDEISFITPVGRKVIFISLKTIIDVFSNSQ